MSNIEKKHVWFIRREHDDAVEYIFQIPHLTPIESRRMGLNLNFIVDIEHDFYPTDEWSALNVAYDISRVYDSYWLNTRKGSVDTLIEYLESIEDDQELLRAEYNVKYAERKELEWSMKLDEARIELEELKNE